MHPSYAILHFATDNSLALSHFAVLYSLHTVYQTNKNPILRDDLVADCNMSPTRVKESARTLRDEFKIVEYSHSKYKQKIQGQYRITPEFNFFINNYDFALSDRIRFENGKVMIKCRGCRKWMEVEDVAMHPNLDEDNFYCGGTERCIP